MNFGTGPPVRIRVLDAIRRLLDGVEAHEDNHPRHGDGHESY